MVVGSKSRAVKSNTVLHCAVTFAVAIFISTGTVLGRPSPFSAAFTAAQSGLDCISAFLGSLIGYIIAGQYEKSIMISSALLAVAAVRMLASRKNTRTWDIISAVTAGFAVFASNLIISHGVTEVLNCAALGIMAGVGGFAMLNVGKILSKRELIGISVSKNPIGMLSVLITVIIATGATSGYNIGIFNPGIILAMLFTCIAAFQYGSGTAAAIGAAAAMGIAVFTGEYRFLAAVLGVSGAIGGVLSSERRIRSVGVLVLAAVICTSAFSMDSENLALTANLFIGAAVALIIPLSKSDTGESVIQLKKREGDVKELFCRRLEFAKGTLKEVRCTIDLTAEKLDGDTVKDISYVYNTACDRVCRRCRFNMQCWGEEYGDSIKQFSGVANALQRGGEISPDSFYGKIGERCPKKDKLCLEMSRLYEAFIGSRREAAKIKGMRNVLTVQLSATEKLLSELSREAEKNSSALNEYNQAIREIFAKLGCEELSAVNVAIADNGGVSVEVYSDKGFYPKREEICEAVTLKLGKQFDLPNITAVDGSYKLSMFSKTPYCLQVEAYQISKSGEEPCGDYYESFIDSTGTAYIMLSDGMGTGSRARIDSSFACGMLSRLIKAGVGISAAMDIINTSLMCKSADESFATLDVCTVNLYTARAVLYKAGGAVTYLYSGNTLREYNCKGLPIGTNTLPKYSTDDFSLSRRDIILLTSDGAALNSKWLVRELGRRDIDIKEFAKTAAETASFYSKDESRDDISVVAMRIF